MSESDENLCREVISPISHFTRDEKAEKQKKSKKIILQIAKKKGEARRILDGTSHARSTSAHMVWKKKARKTNTR
jgi:hypothetical protein